MRKGPNTGRWLHRRHRGSGKLARAPVARLLRFWGCFMSVWILFWAFYVKL
jgi:hypothetical protein